MFEWKASQELKIRRLSIQDCSQQGAQSFVYASDLHLSGTWTLRIVEQLVSVVVAEKPSFVMLGGDLVDRSKALPLLTNCVQRLVQVCPVLAVPGNHDEWVGELAVQQCVEDAGGLWLSHESWHSEAHLSSPSLSPLHVDGVCMPRTPEQEAPFRILCAHDPLIFPKAVQSGYDLVLAGHLHGGQWVLHETNKGLLVPGAWFYRWNGLVFEKDNCRMWVSRGLNDTFPLRWNCPREVLLGVL